MQAPPPPNGPVAPNPDVVAAPYIGYVLIALGLAFAVLLVICGYYRLRAVVDRHRGS